MKTSFLIIVLFSLLFFQPRTCYSIKPIQRNDSIEVVTIVRDFFDWYVKVINDNQYSEYQMLIVESPTGMTTIDYSKYFSNLQRLKFSKSLLDTEIKSYQECLENLSKVTYKDFQDNFDDLDDFEKTNCDFNNYYRWIGGQEPIGGIRIKIVEMISQTKAKVTLDYFYDNGENYGITYWGKKDVVLKRLKTDWEIIEFN
jgi:hypothetical protein